MRVLLVEDEDVIAELTTLVLLIEGHTFDVAPDSYAALDMFENHGPYDVVLSDECHPGLSGTELAKVIREINPTQPIGFLTCCEIEGFPRLFRPCEMSEIP